MPSLEVGLEESELGYILPKQSHRMGVGVGEGEFSERHA